MAPSIHNRDESDQEFILTLSDHESFLASDGSSSTLKSPKKRKFEASTKSTRSKKSKKSNGVGDQTDINIEYYNNKTQELHDESDDGDDDMDSEFEFDLLSGNEGMQGALEEFQGWALDNTIKNSSIYENYNHNLKRGVNLDDIIARRKGKSDEGIDTEALQTAEIGQNIHEADHLDIEDDEDEFLAEDGFGMGAESEDEEYVGEREPDSDDEVSDGTSDEKSVASPVAHPDDIGTDDEDDQSHTNEDPIELARREAFFAPEEKLNAGIQAKPIQTFQDMSLSRPILRGLASVGFTCPTPIQLKTIPVALLGKDVVGGAVTGSGKTAAFIVPILERLLFRPKKIPTSRVVILMPTRELAIQCHVVAKKLASYTDIKFCLAVGGLSLKAQEVELRLRPDIIIGTPGRFIDHMRNSVSFTVDTLEILVLDEADRMLEAGFADELNEIVTTIPKSRQTMLFSATMTSSIDHLIRAGLQKPVRILVDSEKQTVATLIQEFVRLRPGRETKRMGYLLYLCKNIYTHRAIIFFKQKKEAHRARVIFGLSGLNAAELHGSMTQEQRIMSIEAFRDGKAAFLLATDLASRGLDIKGIDTVINYEAPQSHEIYLHRVGRTARAGRQGRACTLAAESDRKVVRAAVKSARSQGAKITSRIIEPSSADQCYDNVVLWENEIDEILKEEKEEKQLAQLEMQVRKGENIIAHREEIQGRPKRTWFESEKEKKTAQIAGRLELNGEQENKKIVAHGKLSNKKKKLLAAKDSRKDGKIWKKGRAEREDRSSFSRKKEDKTKNKVRKSTRVSTKTDFPVRKSSQRKKS